MKKALFWLLLLPFLSVLATDQKPNVGLSNEEEREVAELGNQFRDVINRIAILQQIMAETQEKLSAAQVREENLRLKYAAAIRKFKDEKKLGFDYEWDENQRAFVLKPPEVKQAEKKP